MVGKIFQKYAIYFGFIAIFAAFATLSRHFLHIENISNILVQSAIIAIVAIGQTMVIITGGIDLSTGSVVAFTSMVSGILIVDLGFSIPVGLLLASS